MIRTVASFQILAPSGPRVWQAIGAGKQVRRMLQTLMSKEAQPSTVLHTLTSRDRSTHGAGFLHTLCQ